jgi:hypothetical protein
MRKNARAIVSRWTTPLWPATLAGILVGAAIGGLTLHASSASEATALVRIYQPIDPDQTMTNTAPSPDSQQSFISGEITYLTSPGFGDAVAKELGKTVPPPLSAVQMGKSSTVSLSATQAGFDEAQRSVNAAVKVYSDHLAQQTRERGLAAIDALNKVISRIEADASGEEASQSVVLPTDPLREAGLARIADLRGTVQQLTLQRLAIEAQTLRAAVQVVQPPTETPVKGAPSWSLGVISGGLIGGLLALAGALAWRKRVGVVTSPSVLEGHIQHVLLPTVRLGALTESSEAYAGLARLLYAQLPAPRAGRILLLGASADSGTEEVARLIAFAVAEHTNVCVVNLRDDGVQTFDGIESPAGLTDGSTVVIDGGSLDISPALPGAAKDASQIILVAMIGGDMNDSVRMVSQLARDSDIPISAVCTRRGIWTAGPSRRKTKDSRHATKDLVVADGNLIYQPERSGFRRTPQPERSGIRRPPVPQ